METIEVNDVFENHFVPVYHYFLTMKEKNDKINYSNKPSAKAESLFKLIDDFEFIITLVIMHNIFDDLLPATQKLQSKDLNVAKSADIIPNLKLTIQNIRTSVDEYHNKRYNDALN